MMNFIFLQIFLGIALLISSAMQAIADPLLIDGKPAAESKSPALKGNVQEKVFSGFPKNFILPRPPMPSSDPKLRSSIPNDFFQSTIKHSDAEKDLEKKTLVPLIPSEGARTQTLFPSADKELPDTKPPIKDSGGSAVAPEKKASTSQQKRIIVRIRRVVSNTEAEVAEGAITTAINMVKKDPESNVTIFLDLDAVSLADGEFNYFDQLSTGEDGNLRVISLKHLRSLLTTFSADGGRIVVSEHWAKVRGFRNHTNTIVQGCELLNDEALAELLLSATNVIDY